jgi:hypothetical protein
MTLLVVVERNEVRPRDKEFFKKGCETSLKDSRMGLTLNETGLLKSSGKERFFLGLASFLYKVQNLIRCKRVGFLTFKGL